MIYKGLDDDEADFLTTVVDIKAKKHVEAVEKEKKEISVFRVKYMIGCGLLFSVRKEICTCPSCISPS